MAQMMRKVRFTDIQSLVQDIKFERGKTRALQQSIVDWEKRISDFEGILDDDDEQPEQAEAEAASGESEWKTRFESQVYINQQLEAQLEVLRKRLVDKKAEVKELASGGGWANYKHSDLKKLIIKLQREKNNLESQMKDYEWRIDKEAEMTQKAQEKRKAVYFDIKRQQHKAHPPADHGHPIKLKPIKAGTLAKGSYVRKLLQRKSSMASSKPSLSIGAPRAGERHGGSPTRREGEPSVRSAGRRPTAVRTLPKIGQAMPPKRTSVKLKAEGAEIRKD